MTFDPMEPNTWSAASQKPKNKRTRQAKLKQPFPLTHRAVEQMRDALDTASKALAALTDPEFFENQADELAECGVRLVLPDTWAHRESAWRDYISYAVGNAARAIGTLELARSVDLESGRRTRVRSA